MSADYPSPIVNRNTPTHLPSNLSVEMNAQPVHPDEDFRRLWTQINVERDNQLEVRMAKIPHEQKNKIMDFRRDFNALRNLFNEGRQTGAKLQESSFSKLRDQLSDTYSEFDTLFIDSLDDTTDELRSDYYFDVTENKFINTVLYRHEIKEYIQQNKQAVFDMFYAHHEGINSASRYSESGLQTSSSSSVVLGEKSEEILDPSSQPLPDLFLGEFKIYITFTDVQVVDNESIKESWFPQETHHFGKAPAFIHFYSKSGHLLFKVVYKPRDGRVDEQVIEVFNKINQLKPSERSSNVPLPSYKIWCREDKSIWEYVPGQNITEKHAGGFINARVERSYRPQARKILNRLDAILTQMKISDLHKENVKMRLHNCSKQPIEIIPIDLENYQPSQRGTQLEGRPEKCQLKEQEREIIGAFIGNMKNIASRFLPLGTEALARLIQSPTQANLLYQKLIYILKGDGVIVSITREEFVKFLLESILNNDVPYFSQLGDFLYYGHKSENRIIGTFNTNQQIEGIKV